MRSRDALKKIFTPPFLLRSIAVGLVVGTIVNTINQGVEIAHGHKVVVWKLLLTYLVPFLVASYGGFAALRGAKQDDAA
jgi:hypothetical protein